MAGPMGGDRLTQQCKILANWRLRQLRQGEARGKEEVEEREEGMSDQRK